MTSVSSTASGWANWCRKTFLGVKDPVGGGGGGTGGGEETEPLRALALSSEAEVDETQVEECPICTTATKSKLCSAVPCKHEACERCWLAWQRQQASGKKTCMICAQPVRSINFHPHSGATSARTSRNKGSHFTRVADEALEDALRAMLRMKNELIEIVEKGMVFTFHPKKNIQYTNRTSFVGTNIMKWYSDRNANSSIILIAKCPSGIV